MPAHSGRKPSRGGRSCLALLSAGPASTAWQPCLRAHVGSCPLGSPGSAAPTTEGLVPCLGSAAGAKRVLTARRCHVVGTAFGGGKSCRGPRALPAGPEPHPQGGSEAPGGGAPWSLGVCAYCPPDRATCWSYSDFPVSPTECRRLKAPAKIKFTPRATSGTFQPVRLNIPSSTGELEFP